MQCNIVNIIIIIIIIIGKVGDWKNHFTVAESEQFDEIMKEQLKECDIKFT